MIVTRASLASRACLFAFLFTLPLAAQYSERVDVSIASIDVVVRDRDGNLVRGLTKDDFEVFENGELQTITNFSAIDVRAPVVEPSSERAGESSPVKAVRAPRLLVLFFDIREIDPSSRKEFFETVRAFVDSTVGEGDFASILVWSNRIRVVLPPTSDRARLDAVFDVFANQKFGTLSAALARMAEDQLGQAGDSDAFAREVGMLPTSNPQAEESFEKFVTTEELCARLRRKTKEMRNLLTHLTKIEMKKVLLFASDDTQLRPNRTCDVSGVFAALANTANAYGITIHGLHPPGARTKIIGPDKGGFLPRTNASTPMAAEYARAFNESGGLALLADSTGGVFGIGRQSATELKRAAEELDIYYSIGYSLSAGKEDQPRKVKVVTKNGRYRVRARDSVVRLSEGARLRDEVATNLYFPEQADPQSPAFTARVVRIERDGRLQRVAVKLSIRSSDLFLLPNGNGERKKGSFSVLVAAGRELGDASDVTELRQDFEAGSEGFEETELGYSFETRIRPDTRRLSIAVRDNHTGEVATTIVPLKGEE
jgi:VWFA-related protein